MIRLYQDLRNTPQLLQIVSLSVAEVAYKRNSRVSRQNLNPQGKQTRLPELWYIGSAIGPPRSKSWAAGNPCSWKVW